MDSVSGESNTANNCSNVVQITVSVFVLVNFAVSPNPPVAGQTLRISGALLQDGASRPFQNLGVEDGISSLSRSINTDNNGNFMFIRESLEIKRPRTYLETFIIDGAPIALTFVPAKDTFLEYIDVRIGSSQYWIPTGLLSPLEDTVLQSLIKPVQLVQRTVSDPVGTTTELRRQASRVTSTYVRNFLKPHGQPRPLAVYTVFGVSCTITACLPNPATGAVCVVSAKVALAVFTAQSVKAAVETTFGFIPSSKQKDQFETLLKFGLVAWAVYSNDPVRGISPVAQDVTDVLTADNMRESSIISVETTANGTPDAACLEVITNDNQIYNICAAIPRGRPSLVPILKLLLLDD